jgi:hypothetical protein
MNYADNGKNITKEVLKTVGKNTDVTRVTSAFMLGLFRIVLVEDDNYSFEDLCGDCYNPEANPDIEVTTLARQKRAFRARVNSQGVYGAVMQVRPIPTEEWINIESLWGLVGMDFIGSGYEGDFIHQANDWLFSELNLPNLQTLFNGLK